MSKKTAELAPVAFHPVNDVPDKAPTPQMDLDNPHLSFDDVLPSNYFSMEDLEIWLEERDAESRILTVTGCSVEYVYDPERGEESGDWKPCLSFAETGTMLVINKSRGQQLKKLTNSPFLQAWVQVGQIAIKPGIANGKAQIVITPTPTNATGKADTSANGKTVDEINEELFA
jgi:hypothetical protein